MIQVEHLTKKYGQFKAIDDLNFTVEKGKIYGFLGPNGAGKSTTMNIIAGCLASTEGIVKIDGYDILEDPIEAKKRIGYLPEIPPVYVDKTVREYLRFICEMKGVPKKEIASEVSRVMAATDVTIYENKLIQHLSKGYRQRVGISGALVGDPEVIILDEPTVGLDPRQIIDIRNLIESLREDHTVILSSHILAELQTVCDVFIIIHHGKIVALDTAENLKKAYADRGHLLLVLSGDLKDVRQMLGDLFPEGADCMPGETDGLLCAKIPLNGQDPHKLAPLLLSKAAEAGIGVLELSPVYPTLEEIFIDLISKSPEEGDEAEEEEGSEETEEAEEETLSEERDETPSDESETGEKGGEA